MYTLKPNIILLLMSFLLCNLTFAQEEKEPTFVYPTFQVQKNYSLFGDKVKLRAKPNTTSEVVALLRISDQVKLIEITEELYESSTTKTPWCKVEYKGKTGYILEKFIAHAYTINSRTDFYFRLIETEHQSELLIRTTYGNSEIAYHETAFKLLENSISVTIEGDQGLENVNQILRINYHGDSCGAENGVTYFFLKNDFKLVHIADLSSVGDGGFSESETFTFAEHESSGKLIIIFTKTASETIDEDKAWTESKTLTRQFEWNGTKLVPDFSKKFYKRKTTN